MATPLLENHDSLHSSVSEPILRHRACQLKGVQVPLKKDPTMPKKEYILVLHYALKGSTAIFESNCIGEKGIPKSSENYWI